MVNSSNNQVHDKNQYVSDVSTVDTVWLLSSFAGRAPLKFDTFRYSMGRFTIVVADYLWHAVRNFQQGLQEGGHTLHRQ